MEVAAVDNGMGRVAPSKNVDIDILGTEQLATVIHGKVAQITMNVVVVLQVGTNIDMPATAYGERFAGNPQAIEVDFPEVTCKRDAHAVLCLRQSANPKLSGQQRVIAVHESTDSSIHQ